MKYRKNLSKNTDFIVNNRKIYLGPQQKNFTWLRIEITGILYCSQCEKIINITKSDITNIPHSTPKKWWKYAVE